MRKQVLKRVLAATLTAAMALSCFSFGGIKDNAKYATVEAVSNSPELFSLQLTNQSGSEKVFHSNIKCKALYAGKNVEFKWTYDRNGETGIISDWSGNDSIDWTPEKFGTYKIICKMRLNGTDDESYYEEELLEVAESDAATNDEVAPEFLDVYDYTDTYDYSDDYDDAVYYSVEDYVVNLGIYDDYGTPTDSEREEIADAIQTIEEESEPEYFIEEEPVVSSGEATAWGNVTDYAEDEDKSLVGTAQIEVRYNPILKGICQMPNPDGEGYLIGLESFTNENYKYELLVMDIELFEKGENPWIYATGRLSTSANCLWTIWKPQIGCFITLFRIYDSEENIVDEASYSFVNYGGAYDVPKNTNTAKEKTIGDYKMEKYTTEIIGKVTNSSMTKLQKLRACYDWCVKGNYVGVIENVPDGYTREQWYAMLFFENYQGNCFCYSSAFCQMAKRLGYNAKEVFGYLIYKDGSHRPHGWVEIDGKIYDPQIEWRRGYDCFGKRQLRYSYD